MQRVGLDPIERDQIGANRVQSGRLLIPATAMTSSSRPDRRAAIQDSVRDGQIQNKQVRDNQVRDKQVQRSQTQDTQTQTSFPVEAQPRSQIESLTATRLRKHSDYQRAYAGSRKRQSSSMSWFLAPQTPAYAGAELPTGPRLGLTAGKVLGKAHERNRIKRRMREVLRHHTEMLPAGFDLILHPRRVVLNLEFAKLEQEVVRILHQARSESARMVLEARASVTHGHV